MSRASSSGDQRALVIVNVGSPDKIARSVADILGRPWRTAFSLSGVRYQEESVIGFQAGHVRSGLHDRDRSQMMVVNTHCIDNGSQADPELTDVCDYEFLYFENSFVRRDLARFLTHILGETTFHEDLMRKERSFFLSTTFPDVRTGLPNLNILTVGADVIELRVDLLKEIRSDGSISPVPSLKYVGEQVMILRQRSELPIIYTTRCTNENGKFPMEDPSLYYEYLMRAIQWGVEYIDVELWLPEEIRGKIATRKGSSKIISAFHDFSGNWKWTSEDALHIFRNSVQYADIVKMYAMVQSAAENYELEYFRTRIKSEYPHPPLTAVNMAQVGQLSRALNIVFSPITHPLLPTIAAPGQLSVAEINQALHALGQLEKRDFYAIGSANSVPQSTFFEKCFNELSLPYHFSCVGRDANGSVENYLKQANFGGAYANPPLTAAELQFPSLTDAGQRIGLIDTIMVRKEGVTRRIIGENVTWKGIRATLTREFVPSAYEDRAALILASSEADAAPIIFALRSLHVGAIYTVGFRATGPLSANLEPFTSIDSMRMGGPPFVIISALPPEKSILVHPLLRHYSTHGKPSGYNGGKVFLDLANGPRKADTMGVASTSGWMGYSVADVNAWTKVETLRLLIGQNVPYEFVRMTSGRSLY
ncbi:MAG: hypothetical protein MMC33_008260 [Icmadophila ericetorum]|nr:hypothetical protein [Icmadophila ericetorum]